MPLVIAVLGVLAVLLGLFGLLYPNRFRALFDTTTSRTRFLSAITSRLAMGVLLWYAADELRFPHLMRILAAIAFAAALVVLVMGQERLDRLVNWWLSRSDGLLRASALFAGVFGAFLIYVST